MGGRLRFCSALAALVTLSVGMVGCGDDTVAPEYQYGIAPLADTIHWQSTSVIWTGANEKTASILIVGADWCGWCRKLREETLTDHSVMGLVEKYFAACIIDGDSDSLITVGDSTMSCHDAVRAVFGVRGYPTTIFFDNDGSELQRVPGYYDAENYANLLWRAVERARAN